MSGKLKSPTICEFDSCISGVAPQTFCTLSLQHGQVTSLATPPKTYTTKLEFFGHSQTFRDETCWHGRESEVGLLNFDLKLSTASDLRNCNPDIEKFQRKNERQAQLRFRDLRRRTKGSSSSTYKPSAGRSPLKRAARATICTQKRGETQARTGSPTPHRTPNPT